MKEVPYYTIDEEGNSYSLTSNEAYIDDDDLRELLIEILGDKVSQEDIQVVLDAASNGDMSEEEFDKLVDDFILKNSK